MNIRFLWKLATEEKFVGDAKRRTGVYFNVHEDSSIASTHKLPSVVGFPKKSIFFTMDPTPACPGRFVFGILYKVDFLKNYCLRLVSDPATAPHRSVLHHLQI